jgi:hypothetical protein
MARLLDPSFRQSCLFILFFPPSYQSLGTMHVAVTIRRKTNGSGADLFEMICECFQSDTSLLIFIARLTPTLSRWEGETGGKACR